MKQYKVFIDGEAGTTGLQLSTRLATHPHLTLISLGETKRKDKTARLKAMAEADMVVLCLPDEAAIEAVAMAEAAGVTCPILDASTAHRCHKDWVYGFAELTKGGTQRQKIAHAKRMANTGCYAVGMIALTRPLLDAGMLTADTPLAFTALSGYSGGGKNLIATMEAKPRAIPSHFAYALTHTHKHMAEVVRHSGLTHQPHFTPMVGDFYQGMLVVLPLPKSKVDAGMTIYKALDAHYADSVFIRVHTANATKPFTSGDYLGVADVVDTNYLDIHVFTGEAGVTLIARLDNLGKGAALAAVQNINLVLGLGETTALLDGKN